MAKRPTEMDIKNIRAEIAVARSMTLTARAALNRAIDTLTATGQEIMIGNTAPAVLLNLIPARNAAEALLRNTTCAQLQELTDDYLERLARVLTRHRQILKEEAAKQEAAEKNG